MVPTTTRLQRILADRKTFIALLVLNVLMVAVIIYASRNTVLSDTWSYLGLAEGILHGEYSMWWPLEADYPDTFRTPGYPLFVALVITLFGTWKAALVVQFVLYWVALYLTLKVIHRLDPRPAVRSIFLLLLLPMVNIPFYIGQLYTEIPVLAAIAWALLLFTRPQKGPWYVHVGLGLLFGFIFQCKPIFLLFPIMYVAIGLFVQRDRSTIVGYLTMLVAYTATVLPFAFWNLRNHGVFKPTPLEGAGSYMHLGYWGGKTPAYTDPFYLHNFMGDELIRFTPDDSVPAHIRAYEREWEGIKAQVDPLMTAKDTAMLAARPSMPHPVEGTYNTALSIKREKLLFDKSVEHLLGDPLYTIAYKSYSAVRLWVIGIQRGDFRAASTMGKVQMLYATISTGVVFLLALFLIPLAYRRKVLSFRYTWPMLAYLVYFGVMHLPFTIQARYTTSVRFVMFALLGLAIAGLLWGKAGKDTEERSGEIDGI